MEVQYYFVGLFLGGERSAEAHGDCDHIWSSHDDGETLARRWQRDSRQAEVVWRTDGSGCGQRQKSGGSCWRLCYQKWKIFK